MSGLDFLDRYVQALGGHLGLIATFGDEQLRVCDADRIALAGATSEAITPQSDRRFAPRYAVQPDAMSRTDTRRSPCGSWEVSQSAAAGP